jgi:methylmalonyl-CoA/ethylmalonyl-CoA epimerase
MEGNAAKAAGGAQFTQVAWVVSDIEAAEKFFRETMGIEGFVRTLNLRAKEFEGTYYGESSDAEWHVSIVYSGGSFIELIQPVSGRSIFQDYLENNPAGGVQHIAYSMPVADLDKAVSELVKKGYPVITSLNMPVAKILFFDTYKAMGVVTEIIGITKAGEAFVQNLKIGAKS